MQRAHAAELFSLALTNAMSINADNVNYNPYAAVQFSAPTVAEHDPEAIRNEYLGHEASVKSIGTLYYLGGILGLVLGIVYVCMGGVMIVNPSPNMAREQAIMAGGMILVLGVVFTSVSLFQLWCGYGLRRLRPGARIGSAVLAGFGLIGFPIGTLISAYILYLLLSKKGEVVFSPQYREIVDATPHIKYKTSLIVKIFVGLFIAVIGFGFVAAFIGR